MPVRFGFLANARVDEKGNLQGTFVDNADGKKEEIRLKSVTGKEIGNLLPQWAKDELEGKLISKENLMMTMLRFDGQVWEIAEGHDTDENSVNVRKVGSNRDHKAIYEGITHVQTHSRLGKTIEAHEVRRIR